jgi:hypothetical protein
MANTIPPRVSPAERLILQVGLITWLIQAPSYIAAAAKHMLFPRDPQSLRPPT